MLKNLKLLRAEKNISQRQLGEAIGVSQQSINKYENHEIEPDIQTLMLMAKYFDTSVDFLIGNSDVRSIIEPTTRFDLNAEEASFVETCRKLSHSQRQSIKTIAELYLQK